MEGDAATRLRHWLASHPRLFVLTGAGCSTGSGIPDYRGEDGAWKRSAPITYQAFTGSAATRARYWARSFAGWPLVAQARPNAAHASLADAGEAGRIAVLVTQNVDGLHQRAGSADVVDLHGRIDEVVCLQCKARVPRASLQDELAALNPDWNDRAGAPSPAPDGDAEVDDDAIAGFRVAACRLCGGVLKPDVVFFGENVPRERVALATAALHGADAMLVVGSSLMVYSGYRFAHAARELGKPLAILTRGVTRADALASLKVEADCMKVLPAAW